MWLLYLRIESFGPQELSYKIGVTMAIKIAVAKPHPQRRSIREAIQVPVKASGWKTNAWTNDHTCVVLIPRLSSCNKNWTAGRSRNEAKCKTRTELFLNFAKVSLSTRVTQERNHERESPSALTKPCKFHPIFSSTSDSKTILSHHYITFIVCIDIVMLLYIKFQWADMLYTL